MLYAGARTNSFVYHKLHSMLFFVALLRRVSGTHDELPFNALWRWAERRACVETEIEERACS